MFNTSKIRGNNMKKSCIVLLVTILLIFNAGSFVVGATDDFERGKKAYNSRNFELATQYFRRALSVNPANSTYRYYLAHTLMQTKQLNQAQIEYQRVIQASPYSEEAKYAKIALVQIRDYISNSLNPRWRPANSNLEIGATETLSKANVGDNYIDKVTEKGNVIRWQNASMPLNVYIDSSPKKVTAFQNSFIGATKKGIDRWATVSNGKLSFTYVSNPEAADIKIFWRAMLDSKLTGSEVGTPYTAGVTTPEYSGKELYAMAITLTTTDPNGKTHTPDDIEKVATHEFGHALGIMGHSDKTSDLMYPSSQTDGSLTKRDINTINLLYELDPDISNFRNTKTGNKTTVAANKEPTEDESSDSKKNEILGSKEERIQKEIAQIEEAVRENPKSDINHVNLGNLYGDKGEFDKAIREYKKAIQLNPKNEVAYSNLGAMYQNAGKPYDALRAYNQSKQLNPNKPKPYLQIAIISEQLNQKAEAVLALKQYLQLNPKANADKDIQILAKKLDVSI